MDAACDRCGFVREDTLHVLRDCPYSMAIWNRLLVNVTHQRFFLDGFKDWLVSNLHTASSHGDTQLWSLTFGVVIWRLWFWRNKVVFNHDKWESDRIMLDISSRVVEIQRCCISSFNAGKRRVEKWIRWSSPTWPWVKLNTDGARKDSGVAGAGGLVRDYRGVWQIGFCINLGACSVLTAELWGLYHGLCMASQRGFRRIWVEVDSKPVTQILANPTTPVNEHHSPILAIRELLSRDWIVRVNHIYREANIAADFLASFSLPFPLGLQLLTDTSPILQSILNNDVSGVDHSRLVVF
ncbi:putative ribonuclease H protein [Citrus sinensis]|uniref:Ribonuclease H protein n=1 Tax=Citrus sinensis TaxID=2711 RepID=A0ACB8L5R1_CITSI|nr:putative ribonuclease H protein [Citrus sinensis]